jgi:uncharacterized protein with ParB-like and HNH nuclease domain
MSSSSNQFSFQSSGIAKVFSNRLQVPKHQREYSWEEEQVNQLLEDLLRAFNASSEYFLGTIVTISDPKTPKILEIIDGQQRLTTTFLLLLALKNYAASIEGQDIIVQSIENDFLYTIDRKRKEKVSRIALNIDDNEFFQNLILEKPKKHQPTRQSHHLLLESYQVCKRWVSERMKSVNESDRVDHIIEWNDFLEQQATVVLLTTSNKSQAFKMFETLNDRGLGTSQADLVKSYLFGQSDDRISEAQSRWSSMKDNIDALDDDDGTVNFLRHVIIATKEFVRAQEVYDVVQKKYRSRTQAVKFLTDLEKYSNIYVSTFNSEAKLWKKYSKKTKKYLSVFQMFNLFPARPLIFSLAFKFNKNDFEKAIALVVSITVRLVISGKTRSGVNEQAFAKAALKVYNGEITKISQLKSSLANVMITDDEFNSSFVKARSSKAELMRYYLRALEQTKANEKHPWYVPNDDTNDINLEHILPKRPDFKDWPSFKPEVHRLYLTRMGNQCLLKSVDNSRDGNSKFTLKRPDYKKSPYHFTESVGKESKWGVEQIDKRQKEMAQIALKTWKY